MFLHLVYHLDHVFHTEIGILGTLIISRFEFISLLGQRVLPGTELEIISLGAPGLANVILEVADLNSHVFNGTLKAIHLLHRLADILFLIPI